jgi:hypothetical protein
MIATAIVTAVVIACALVMFAAVYNHPEELWRDLGEDRAAHYNFGLDLAIDLRSLWAPRASAAAARR